MDDRRDGEPLDKPKPKAKAKAKAEAGGSQRVARIPLRFILDPNSSLSPGALEVISSGQPDASDRPLAFQLRGKKKITFGKKDLAK